MKYLLFSGASSLYSGVVENGQPKFAKDGKKVLGSVNLSRWKKYLDFLLVGRAVEDEPTHLEDTEGSLPVKVSPVGFTAASQYIARFGGPGESAEFGKFFPYS